MNRAYVDVTEFRNPKENCNVPEKKTSKDGKIHAQMLPLVIFMRHGQAESNVNRILAGRHMESHLTEQGRQQVVDSAKQLVKTIAIEKVYASPVVRTVETAQIVCQILGTDYVIDLRENTSMDSADYGAVVRSECGLEGILVKTDVDAIRANDFEGMGLDYFRKKFGGIETVFFFMPPLLRTSQEIAIAEGLIPDDMICERCRDNLEAKVRNTEWIVKRDKEEEGRRNKDHY